MPSVGAPEEVVAAGACADAQLHRCCAGHGQCRLGHDRPVRSIVVATPKTDHRLSVLSAYAEEVPVRVVLVGDDAGLCRVARRAEANCGGHSRIEMLLAPRQERRIALVGKSNGPSVELKRAVADLPPMSDGVA